VVDEKAITACLGEIQMALLQADVNVGLVKKLKDNIIMQFKLSDESGSDLRKMILGSVVQEVTAMLTTERKPYEPKKGKSNVIMLVGLQGSGKTTTCTKLAYHWKKKNFRVCLVCADTFRAGAFDQLKQNATKVRIPFYGSYTETDPVAIAKEGVEQFRKEGFEIIIVDTSGKFLGFHLW
jgi:signal recognition particle subunit SRP54